MSNYTISQISVGAQIGGVTINIDKTSINLSQDEVIILTNALLKIGAGLELADVMPTPEQSKFVADIITKFAK